MYDFDNLTCVLLHGPSASGKTETARRIASSDGIQNKEVFKNSVLLWDHKYLAGPLAEMFTVKTTIQGYDEKNRKLWMLHHILTELFPYGTVDFNSFIKLVYIIEDYRLDMRYDDNGGLIRDRNFMTFIADQCHKLYNNIFAKYLIRKIASEKISYKITEPDNTHNIVIVSDLRLLPELEAFEESGMSLIKIKFDVSPEVQEQRMIKRDAAPLTDEQKQHPTQISPFQDSHFDLVINSDTLNINDQVSMVKDFIIQNANIK